MSSTVRATGSGQFDSFGRGPRAAMGPFSFCTAPESSPRRPHLDKKADQARLDFEVEWRQFSARRTPADYQAWRDQRDWTARKYAMWERGERFPSQQANPDRKEHHWGRRKLKRDRPKLRVASKSNFLRFRLRSFWPFRVANGLRPVLTKSTGYERLEIAPRNTDAT
jgi:hypothetical protein